MWIRRTYHECAQELSATSNEFRLAYKSSENVLPRHEREDIVRQASMQGVELLRILALSVRSDQDYGLTAINRTTVGAVKSGVNELDVVETGRNYQPPYSDLKDFEPLGLRQALNKIAYLNPSRSAFFADESHHDLIVSGSEQKQGQMWIAIISIIDLCCVIEQLPDAAIRK